ncbi:MAG TPA: aspartyl/asparaginyl beta-hydroxylase domain-containing protein [Dokdonella sp.]|uniref:aspartyl/asparaginyl beta-hydroxylase domain-containing protein n=1 Tax=Dokdonella sp. TaxID=2291710 RepID=UPI002D7E87EF|nr:aspartyl/asparaginyl beta-hydroxylase domain-containing protein [Dokdonella sp.]HET9034412.1 aspartyl/asparaginyl beta-hydroxylase domain-containing protein [Dokdonella sp.]
MLTLPDQPLLDKIALIGGCARLDFGFDAERALSEITALPDSSWGSRAGRVGVHDPAQAIFLRGHAPAQGDLPVEDRDELAQLPYLRELIKEVIPAPALRCVLAQLSAGGIIAPHIDQGEYFSKTIRLHFPITTNENVWMNCAGLSYQMHSGEIWALNNSIGHGVINADASRARLHMICDFLSSAELVEILARADRGLGRPNPAIKARLIEAQHQAQQAGKL